MESFRNSWIAVCSSHTLSLKHFTDEGEIEIESCERTGTGKRYRVQCTQVVRHTYTVPRKVLTEFVDIMDELDGESRDAHVEEEEHVELEENGDERGKSVELGEAEAALGAPEE